MKTISKLIILLALLVSQAQAQYLYEKIESVFTNKDGDGGENVHLPSLIVTESGVIVATCQLRKASQWDFGNPVDLLVTRSLDGGKTWEEPSVLYSAPDINAINGPIIEDKVTGELIVPFTAVPVGDKSQQDWVNSMVRRGGMLKYVKSTDDGATWSEVVDTKPISEQNKIAWPSNAGHGIQLANGRLVIGAFIADVKPENETYLEHEYKAGLMYSDDHGETWIIGAEIPYGGTDENVVVETRNGDLYFNFRHNNRGPKDLARGYAYSRDQGESFYEFGLQDNMSRSNCHVGIASLSTVEKDGRHILLYSGPQGGGEFDKGDRHQRTRLTIRASYDGGRNWPTAQIIEEGYSGYSDLAVLQDGTIVCLLGVNTFLREDSRMDIFRVNMDTLEYLYEARQRQLN